jgi:hypothetical protein
MKDLFAREALAQIPKILTLLDRNAHSRTYGCFDRNFWHYKIIDFPSGMAQEFVWPLALAFDTPAPENPFYQQPALRDWVQAAILFAARNAHEDGSCDDYFPYEKAGGAAAFSLLACIESYTLLQLHNDEMLRFFRKRANWLAHHQESGRLTNHQALIVLCLELLSRLLNSTEWETAKNRRLERIIEWQDKEGWFPEYEGADPGYHSLTVSLLAQLYAVAPRTDLKVALEKATLFANEFVHPDGSIGGEYASRNTYNFFPHGFELLGVWMPEALAINDRFLGGLLRGLAPCYADDHIIGHHTWSYLLAYRCYVQDRPQPRERSAGAKTFSNAGLFIDRRKASELYVALNKGGAFKFFRDERLVCSDTQFSLQLHDGRNAVGHLVDRYETQTSGNALTIRGSLGWAKQKEMTITRLLALRMVMLCGGRFFPDLIRKILQRLLITGKTNAPFRFERTFSWRNGALHVRDVLRAESWSQVKSVGIGADQTSVYVVMSRTFQRGQLQPWIDLTPRLGDITADEGITVERQL